MAADGRIVIDVILESGEVARGVADINNQLGGMDSGGQKAASGIGKIVTALGLVALASKGIDMVKQSLSGAISRFDTLAGFPVVLSQMGFSAEESSAAINRLSEGIQGLPTTLDDVAKTAKGIAVMTGDLEGATDITLALNNAFLASGSSSADASRGLLQYTQMLSKGSVDMMSWRTLQETMGVALNDTAKAFGFAGASAQNDLYAALKDGDITFDQFNAKLIELSAGTNGFAERALTSSAGIATSFGNLRNAMVVGIANMITTFNNLTKEVTGKDIAANLDGMKVIVKNVFKAMNTAIESAAPIVKAFAAVIMAAIPVVQALTPAIIGLASAYAAYTIINTVVTAVKASNAVLAIAQASTAALTVVTRAQIASQIQSATATTAVTAATIAQTGAISLSTLAIGVMTGRIGLATAATVIKTAATYALGAAVKFLMGPIGWITAGIALLVTGVIAVVKWFNRSTEEGEKLAATTTALADSTSALNESTGSSASAHEKNQRGIQASAEASGSLVTKIEELMAVEKRSGAQTKELNSYVSSLNGAVDGLSLAYDKESNSLSLSSEQIAAKITLMKEKETLMAGEERFLEIAREQAEVEMQKADINALQEEWNQKKADGTVKTREAKDALAELDVQEKALTETGVALAEQRVATEAQVTASIEAVAVATENSVVDQVASYDFLKDHQQAIVDAMKATWEDYKAQATNMFDVLSEKSEVSVSKMTKNLEENQRIMGEWATNIAKLAERGIDEGLLNTLREAGPESAGHVKAIVNSSDAELEKLSTAFSKGGDVATKALNTSLDAGKDSVMSAVGHMVTETGTSLAQAIKAANFGEIGTAIPEGMAGGVEDGTPDAVNASKKMANDTTKAAEDALGVKSPSRVFKEIGTNITQGLVLGIDGGAASVVAAIQKMLQTVQTDSSKSLKNIVKSYDASIKEIETALSKLAEIMQKAMKLMLDKLNAGSVLQVKAMADLAKDLTSPFKNTPTQFEGVGKDAMAGFNRGIKSGEAQVMATARLVADSVATTMRKALDIHSPSRVLFDIGKWAGIGLADGMKSAGAINEKVVLGLGQVIKAATTQNEKDILKIGAEAEKARTAVQVDYAKRRAELARKTGQSALSAIKTKKDKKGKIIRTGEANAYKIRAEASHKLEKLNEDENIALTKINNKAVNDMMKKSTELDKKRLESIKLFIQDKKSLEELTLIDEAVLWEKSISLFKKGTKERVDAQKAHKTALDAVNKEILSINDSYSKEMKAIMDATMKQEKEWTDAYDKEFEDRKKSLMSFAGTFDEFKVELDRTANELMENLKGQVDAFKLWQSEFDKLSSSGIDGEILAELSALGVKALPELVALNSMTKEQLTQYSELFREKSALARTQTEKELEGTKKDMDRKILELRQVAEGQLNKLQTEWMLKIKNLTSTTASELSTLRQIGIDAGTGLLQGLASMEGPLVDKARAIADAIKAEMASALDIHSPSRWMRDFIAGNMAKGFDVGVDKNKTMLTNSAKRMTDYMKPDFVNTKRGARVGFDLAGKRSMQSINSSSNSNYDIDKSRTMHNQVTVQSQDEKATYERMMRKFAFEFGI